MPGKVRIERRLSQRGFARAQSEGLGALCRLSLAPEIGSLCHHIDLQPVLHAERSGKAGTVLCCTSSPLLRQYSSE